LLSVPETKGGLYMPNEVIHQHFADKLKIPTLYYRRMLQEAPELLAANVNGWLAKNDEKNMMLRTFENLGGHNIARGYLSDRYGVMDNYEILFAILGVIKESGLKVVVRQADVTDKRLHVRIVNPEVEVQSELALRNYLRDSQVGNGIMIGLTITNSEVGYGSFEIRPSALIKKCMNGLIIKDDGFRKVHMGAKLEAGNINWSESTKKKNLDLVLSQTKDALTQFLSEDYLRGVVQKLETAAGIKLDNPIDTIENVVLHVADKISMTEENKKNILNYFVGDGDTSALGVVHAITREAQNMDADTRYDLEAKAFEILPQIKGFDKVSKN
jgi:hypothetical protein